MYEDSGNLAIAGVLWRLRIFRRRLRFKLVKLFADKRQILHVEERDVEHVTDNQHGAASLNDFEHSHIHRFAPDGFNERQHDVPPIEDRDRQQIQDRQVHVENHAEPKRQLPAAFALEEQIVDTTDSHRTAEMLQLYVRLRRSDGANGL